ncbi:unnamed protein product [Spirodela intermedia]|uniref:Uncharacterized protein n=1 Tax=Spirodela intermedia TaxID=51605 RepID=A0A7I8KP50_SPIIN|nr:unnamed protein product [Spirodela intermedia]
MSQSATERVPAGGVLRFHQGRRREGRRRRRER